MHDYQLIGNEFMKKCMIPCNPSAILSLVCEPCIWVVYNRPKVPLICDEMGGDSVITLCWTAGPTIMCQGN